MHAMILVLAPKTPISVSMYHFQTLTCEGDIHWESLSFPSQLAVRQMKGGIKTRDKEVCEGSVDPPKQYHDARL